MENIKNLEKVILPEFNLLMEVVKPKRAILLPDGSDDEESYGIVVCVHETIKDLEPGDIAVKFQGKIYAYPLIEPDGTEKMFSVLPRGAIAIAVKPDNFIDPITKVSMVKI